MGLLPIFPRMLSAKNTMIAFTLFLLLAALGILVKCRNLIGGVTFP